MSDEFRQLLEAGDVDAVLRAWHKVAPGAPKPDNREDAEVALHMARTAAVTIGIRHKAFSHRWLCERGLPSQLPDELKPVAERLYPRVVEAVGISVNFSSPWMAPAAAEVSGEIAAAVEECYADGRTGSVFVKERMTEARNNAMRRLFGRIGG